MAWDGSGNYNRTDGTRTGSDLWVQNRDANIKILATLHDNADEDMATAIENCVTRDGQNSPTQDLPMATYKHTNVGAATAFNQYARVDQVQRLSYCYGGTAGSSTAYTITIPITPSAYIGGLVIIVQFHTDNGTSPTINVNGLGATPLLTPTGAPSPASLKANAIYMCVHDGTNGFYIIGA